MREFNINMEGYNVNGICVGCLAHGRKMFTLPEVSNLFRLLADIEVPVGVWVQLCWECTASAVAVKRFSKLVQDSYEILKEYSRKNPFLSAPSDLSKHHTPRLTIKKCHINIETLAVTTDESEHLVTGSEPIEVKEEKEDDLKFEHIEVEFENKDTVKSETPADLLEMDGRHDDRPDAESAHHYADAISDDESLSTLSARKVKEKKEKGGKKRKKNKFDKKKEKVSHTQDVKERRALQLRLYRTQKNLPPECVQVLTMSEQEMTEMRARDMINPDFSTLKYKCENCVVGFNARGLMEEHVAKKHSKKEDYTYTCDVCTISFLSHENMQVHRKLHLTGYRCVQCDYTTGAKHLMMRHLKRIHRTDEKSTDEFKCKDCEDIFDTKSKLNYHRAIKHTEKPQCDCCGKVFANKMTLKYHLKILPYDKNEDGTTEKVYLPCKGCGKVFYSKKSYRAHIVIHEEMDYPCPICGKLFQWKRNLARHIRNHREKDVGKYYECRPCGKRFSSKDCYTNHMKLSKRHVSEEQFGHACEHCGRRFPTRRCLVDHIDWEHMKKIKYECSHCLRPFKTHKTMVAHINNVHGGKKGLDPNGAHLCDICGKSYKTEKRLKNHLWAMHTHRATAKIYKCKHCPATFTWQTSIYKHTKMVHSGGKQRKGQPRVMVARKRSDASALPNLETHQFFNPPHNQLHVPV